MKNKIILLLNNKIRKLASNMDEEHCDLVLFKLDIDTKESLARTMAMGFFLKILKKTQNKNFSEGYVLSGTRDRLLFIIIYPLAVSSSYFILEIKQFLQIE